LRIKKGSGEKWKKKTLLRLGTAALQKEAPPHATGQKGKIARIICMHYRPELRDLSRTKIRERDKHDEGRRHLYDASLTITTAYYESAG